jgi:hypothetical protein
MNDKELNKGKPEASRIPGVDESCTGQNPHWPGDSILTPGENEEKSRQPGVTEKTKRPVVPNHPTANGQ